MNDTMLRFCRQTLIACAAVVLLAPVTAKADSFDNDFWWPADPIEGLWNAKVTVTNCANGAPLPVSFEAMGLFGRGGTFNNTDAANPLMPALRSSIFGTWKRLHARTYQFAFRLFRFDLAGTLIGTQVVRHTLTLAKDGKSYASAGTSQAYDVAGNPLTGPPTGCSISTATRFQ